MACGALTSSYTAPPQIATAGGGGGSLLQGGALPNITTTQSQATAAPSWYTDYLQNIANTGTTAGSNAQFIGIQPMQQQAYCLAKANVGNYQPDLNTANGALSSALSSPNPLPAAQPYLNQADNPTYNTVQNYMNPYTKNVVCQIGTLAQQNVMNNIAPQTSAGLVGSGQFGSQRGANALASNIGQYGQQTTAQQVNALNTGYQNAMTEAQQQAQLQAQIGATAGCLASRGQQNLTNAAQVGGQLATTTQNLGLGDVNALDTLGTQQQQILQAQQLFPLQIAQQQAQLLQGAQIPTSSSSSYTGPIPGAYSNAPLSNIAGIGSLLNGATNGALGSLLGKGVSGLFGSSGGSNNYNTTSGEGSVYGACYAANITPSAVSNINPGTGTSWACALVNGTAGI